MKTLEKQGGFLSLLHAIFSFKRGRAYYIFIIVSMALLMSSIDATIVAVGLPTMMYDLRTNLAWVGWTITAYQLSQSIIMPIVGKMSDEWGRKPLFLGSVLLFTASSAAAGLSTNIYLLIIFRFLQGVGGGAFLPSATGIVSDAFSKRRATAIGLFGSIFPIGGILGPNLGGFIIENISWRWIFFVNVPIGLALLLFGAMILPGNKPTSAGRRVDTVGAGLFAAAMLVILYGMTTLANHPEDMLLALGFFATGVILLVLLFRHENRVESPMIELKLLRWRPFLATNIYNLGFGAVVFGFFSFVPYYATIAYGMSTLESGFILTPRSLAMMVASTITSVFVIRFRYRPPMIVGLVGISLSLFLLSRGYHDASILGIGLHNVALLTLIVMISGIGMGIVNPAANNAALDLIPEKVAAVAGLRGMFRFTGGMLGTAGFVLVLSRYTDKAVGMQEIFMGLGILLLFLIPLVFMIPDTAHMRRNHRVNMKVNAPQQNKP